MKKMLSLLFVFVIFACSNKESRNEKKDPEMKNEIQSFLDAYLEDLAQKELTANLAYWKAANSGNSEDYDLYSKAAIEQKKLHSDSERYEKIKAYLDTDGGPSPMQRRSLELARIAFTENQLPQDVLEVLVKESTQIEQTFATFRPVVDSEPWSNNRLLQALAASRDSAQRERLWRALKEVGQEVAPSLIQLAQIRNQAATSLGFKNYWEMKIRLSEYNPPQLMDLMERLEQETRQPFFDMKARMDGELAQAFSIDPKDLMPWHYDNPFFQSPSPSKTLNLDSFYENLSPQDIVELGRSFFEDIGLQIDSIVENSDFFEREGKDQHAFCMSVDRGADVRMLLNVRPTADWMDTMLHEMGHAVYYAFIDPSLPFNLKEAAHIFTTEAVAMMFGALAKNPLWMQTYLELPEEKISPHAFEILEQRRKEQLIFARWTMVMFHFERALYEDPLQDLNSLWYQLVAKYQGLRTPHGPLKGDWASKPHFTIAPVYYHNYLLGEVFAASLRKALAHKAAHQGPAHSLNWKGRKDFGAFLKETVFAPGMSKRWPQFVKDVTGQELAIDDFVEEIAGKVKP